MKISKKVFSLTGLLLAATLLLAACGEDATTPPAPTSPTAAPTALATTGGTASTGTTVTDNTLLPAFTGTTEVLVDATIGAEVAKQLGVPTLAVRLFSSDDDTPTVGTAVDTALTAKGYAFGIPGAVKPISQDSGVVGLYSKSGSSDILFTAVPIPTNTVDVGKSIPGIDAASAQKFADQIKGKKTLLIVMTGPNLLQALVQLGQNAAGSAAGTPGGAAAGATPTVASATLPGSTTVASTTSSGATTAATTSATGTTASATSAGAVSGADVIAYAGATGITLPDVLQTTLLSGLSGARNATLNGFKSSDAPATVKTGLMNTYSQGGWTDATASFTGASDALSKLGPDAFFIAYTKDNKLSFVLGLSGYTAGLLGVSGADANGTVYIVGSGEK